MITASKISSFILVASIAGYFTIIPASVTIHVGDDSDRVNEIGRYGHIQLRFSVRHIGNKSLRPTTFWIGPDHHKLMIWHNDRIESITYFRTEPPPPDPTYRGNRYHEWRDVQEFDSFTVNRPSPNRFFIGIAILSVTGLSAEGRSADIDCVLFRFDFIDVPYGTPLFDIS